MNDEKTDAIHKPIMLAECMEALLTSKDGIYIDATFGDGGHTLGILQKVDASAQVLASDRDTEAVTRGKKLLAGEKRLEIRHLRFSQLEDAYPPGRASGMLMDLGVSSRQLDIPERGFSFQSDGPIDMRMDRTSGKPLGDLLVKMSNRKLTQILAEYGEEPRARRIADAILAQKRNLHTTGDLAKVVQDVMPAYRRRQRLHPATRVFAALRIFINEETEELKKGLMAASRLLAPGGILAVIGFQALEHRIVKKFVRENPVMRALSKHMPDRSEVLQNPRARSAVLRVMRKNEI